MNAALKRRTTRARTTALSRAQGFPYPKKVHLSYNVRNYSLFLLRVILSKDAQ